MNEDPRVSACLGLRLTNDFEIDSTGPQSHNLSFNFSFGFWLGVRLSTLRIPIPLPLAASSLERARERVVYGCLAPPYRCVSFSPTRVFHNQCKHEMQTGTQWHWHKTNGNFIMYIIKINYFGFGLEPGTETGTYPGTLGVLCLACTTVCPFLANCFLEAECIFMAFSLGRWIVGGLFVDCEFRLFV